MSILDTFYLLFKSDASDLDKGLGDSTKKAKEATEAIKKTDEAAYKLGESIGKTIRDLGGVLIAGLAVHKLVEGLQEAATYADELGKAAARIDAPIEEFSAWSDAVAKSGGTAQGFAQSLDTLSQSMSMIEVTGKSRVAPFFKELGIDLEATKNKGKTAFDFLPDIATSFEKLSKAQSLGIGRKLGLDAGTITLLQSGRRAVDDAIRQQKELGAVTAEQVKVSEVYNDQISDMQISFRSLYLEVATAVLPVFTWFSKTVTDFFTWMRNNKDLVVGVFIALGAAIAVFVLPPLLTMAAAAIAAIAPFLLIAAAVAALSIAFGLIYDDVVNFMAGNDSLIGQFMDKYPKIAEVLRGIGDVFKWLMETLSSLGEIFVAVFNLGLGALETFWASLREFWGTVVSGAADSASAVGDLFNKFLEANPLIKAIVDAVVALGRLFGGVISGMVQGVADFISSFGGIIGMAKRVGEAITSGLASAKQFLGIKGPEVRQESGTAPAPGARATAPAGAVPGLAEGRAQLGAISGSPIGTQSAAATGARTSNKTTNVNVGEVNVQTQATDAAGISKALGDSMGAQMRQAASNFDDGVAA